ncbi:MAG: TetR/AcrR family transcriptional regulator [Pyrinomonadaceae bacterium]|nr:TetR/AcrR family transcriptional regulator [Pyrinomonadaceae bacterium]
MKLKSDQRRQQILAVTVECFVKRGFHQTTLQDISRAANISPALIYKHFESKEVLIKALIESHEAEWMARFDSTRETGDFMSVLKWLFEIEPEEVASVKNESVILLEVLAEALRNKEIADVVRHDDAVLSGGLTELIKAEQTAGEIDESLPAAEVAEILLALSDGLMLRLALADDNEAGKQEKLIQTLKILCVRFLGLPSGEERKL